MSTYAEGFSDPALINVVRAVELNTLRSLTYRPGTMGSLIAVLGDPGSGKTHLIAALVRERQWTHLPATVHQCSRGNQERALDTIRALLRGARHADAGRENVRSVSGFDRNRRRPDRELVVLEDAHLADEPTIQELVDIATGTHPPLVDVIVSLRPRQTPDELKDAIAFSSPLRHTEHIELAPLSDEQMLAMCTVSPSYELRRRSGGNPFNLRALQALEQSTRSGGDAAVAPLEFAAIHETRDLTLNERYVLHAAAILRSNFDTELLADVADMDPLVVSAAARSLVRRDLIRVQQMGTLFSIRDDAFGALLRRTIDPCWAARAHQRAIKRLSARGQAGTQLGFHLVGSLSSARADELAQIVDASYEIMETDITEAIFWLTPVIGEAPAGGVLGTRARLALCTAFGRSGRLAESRDLLHVVHESAAPIDPQALAEQIAFVCVVEGVLSQEMQTIDLLSEHIERPDLRDTPIWPRLVFARGFRVTMVGATADMDEIQAALGLVRDERTDLTRAGLLGLHGLHAVSHGDVTGASAAVITAGDMLDRSPEHLVAQHLDCLFTIALANVYLGRYVDAQRHLHRGVEIARHRQRPFLLPTLLILLSESHRHLGLLSQARDAADAAIIESSAGNAMRHAQAVALKAAAEVWRQPVASGRAKALAQQALAQQAPSAPSVNGSASIAALALAKCAWLDGDPHHCVTLLLNEGKGPELSAMPMAHRNTVWEMLCAAGLDAGLPVDDWARRSREHARAVPIANNLAYADLTAGHLARARGTLAEAARCYRRAAQRFASVSMLNEQCYTLGQAARTLTELGLAEQAADAVALGTAIARRSGALTMIDWIGRRLPERSTGTAGARPVAAQMFDRLTRRELEIAQLICAGMKRRDIAENLAISMRTVDVHLTRIYRKAGVSSRMELAVAMGRMTVAQG